jgi:hypothetical protein
MGPDFRRLEGSILQSVIDQDWDRLSELLDDDFVITTAGWLDVPADKESWIGEVSARHLLTRFEIRSLDVLDLGAGFAVVLMLSTQWAVWKGEPFEGDFRYTDVWRAGDADRWQLVVRHASLVPPK